MNTVSDTGDIGDNEVGESVMLGAMEDASDRRALAWIAGAASLGAGAVHAAAIGAHAEHPAVVKTFTVLAVAQLGWGALQFVRQSRLVSSIGLAVNGAALVGWIMAKTSGISFVDGLEASEPTQWADGLCAALAAVAVLTTFVAIVRGANDQSASTLTTHPAFRRLAIGVSVSIAALTLTGMNAAAVHRHEGDGHGETAAAHSHGGGESGGESAHAGHADSAVAPVPYDPGKPIDLGGVEGVSPEQQARAENLIAVTLARLPQFADVTTLEAKGYHSINDAMTGHEHYINWALVNDGRELDPDYPEALVFEMVDGKKTLVSAMFMAEGEVELDEVPDVGGALTQWHIHDNLCYTASDPPRVAGLTIGDGICPQGLRTLGKPRPMIHVWIRAHKCGPFAALDGVGAGQVKEGETTLCDTAHGHTH